MTGHFIGIHRYLCIRKALLAAVSSDEFNTMSLNSKLSKAVSYIQNNNHDDELFDRILEIDQNSDIILKVIHKKP